MIIFHLLRALWVSAMMTSVGLVLLLIVLRNTSRDPVIWFYIAMGGGLFIIGGMLLAQSLCWFWRWLRMFFR